MTCRRASCGDLFSNALNSENKAEKESRQLVAGQTVMKSVVRDPCVLLAWSLDVLAVSGAVLLMEFVSQMLTRPVSEKDLNLKPIAAIGHPPTQEPNGNGRCECPPKWQSEISRHAQHSEHGPKHFSLHLLILAWTSALQLRITPHALLGTQLGIGGYGGRDRDRTGDPLLAKQVLSQLSYTPTVVVEFILWHFPPLRKSNPPPPAISGETPS